MSKRTAVLYPDNCKSPPEGDLGGLNMKKKFIALIICTICITAGYAQNFSTELLTTVNQRDVSVVTVNQSMIETLRRREQNREVQAFLNDLNFLRIISSDNPRNAVRLYENAVSALQNNPDFEELLSMEEGRQRVKILALNPQNNRTREIVMISYISNTTVGMGGIGLGVTVANTASLTIVNITGDIDIGDLSQLATTIRNLR